MRCVFISFLTLAVSVARAQTPSFAKSIYPIFEKAGCAQCHNGNGVASATRLHFPEAGTSAQQLDAFGKSLVILVDRDQPDNSLLLKKPTKRVAHGGGERIKIGSPEEAALRSWITVLTNLSVKDLAQALRYTGQTAGAAAPNPTLRRLTQSQYNNTVHDLLGDQTAPANRFPPDDFINGFTNQYDAQSLSPLLEEGYSDAAERLAVAAFRTGDSHHLVPCSPSVECRTTFVANFGKKAFRRPLTAQETRRYVALFTRDSDFMKGAQLVVEAMLQSPNFLFRLDATPSPALKAYATANRLSYTLWDTMPDEALVPAGARGDLNTPQGVTKVAEAMLRDPRARPAFDEFIAEWLRFDRVFTATRDRRRYPQYRRETAVAMTQEAQLLLEDMVWNNRNFIDAFSPNYGFVNAELAPIYGVPVPAKEFDRIEFPAGSERAGLLGQALFLTQTSKPEDASLTARGLFVRQQFLCQNVPPPPPGVDTNLPASTEEHPQTNRDRMSAHVSNPVCASCHNLMDPIGFGLEKFDAIGQHRDDFKLTFAAARGAAAAGATRGRGGKTVTLPIDAKGSVVGLKDSDFSSPKELGAILAVTPQCQMCMVKQYFRYATGRMETAADGPVLDSIFQDFKKSNYSFKELILSLIRSREFPGEKERVNVASNH